MKVRPAKFSDSAEIVEIWNPYIKKTFVTFNASEKTQEEVCDLIKDRRNNGHEFWVASLDGEIIQGLTDNISSDANGLIDQNKIVKDQIYSSVRHDYIRQFLIDQKEDDKVNLYKKKEILICGVDDRGRSNHRC